MLECYNPAERLYAPYHYCNYLYTDSFAGVEAEAEGVDLQQQKPPSPPTPAQYGGLRGIYSHFRPVEQEDTQPRRRRGRWRRRQSNDAQAAAAAAAAAPERSEPQEHQQPQPQQQPKTAEERPSVDVYLDEDESFAQLCTITNLVRMGPKPGLFRSHINVSDGVIRVWRDWLAAQASSGDEGGILWADAARDVGVRFRVAEKDTPGQQQPVLVASDEQLPVAYRLEFEELLVRSSALLVMMEAAEVKEVAAEGKAIVLAL
jgi:hypothetical protein